jgi:hypothetical protein
MGKIFFLTLFFLLILNSCTVDYNVLVHKDGSAHIVHSFEVLATDDAEENTSNTVEPVDSGANDEMADLFKAFYDSDQISNFHSGYVGTKYKIEYDLKNIDSLGNYIDPFLVGVDPVKFNLDGNKFSISQPQNETVQKGELDITGTLNMVVINLTIEFEKTIKKMSTKNDFIRQEGTNKIIIESNVGDIDQYIAEKKCVVVFDK